MQNETNSIDKWDKAVINIEGEGMPMTSAQRQQIFDTTFKLWRSDPRYKDIDDWTLKSEIETQLYSMKSHAWGTAIYLQDGDKRYLITAAHVIIDKIATLSRKQEIDQVRQYYKGQDPVFVFPSFKVRRRSFAKEYINPGYRTSVLSIDGFQPEENAYSMDVDHDIAIISLNMTPAGRLWNESLDSMGYQPISITDINFDFDYPIGTELMCIGFPSPSAIPEAPNSLKGMGILEGSARTLPVYSWGKIALSHDSLYYFWGDISIYPGNSGGPVLHNNKMIGVVSAQASISVENQIGESTNYSARVPFGFFIKAKGLKRLLKEMQSREIPPYMQ